jgi:hypothetical protein
LARAPYLSVLGVDEMVRPDCFALLAAELDADPTLDWVQGNSVITEVSMQGTLARDVMLYQRIPYEQDLVYLETCYLSWVGGLYRKSMHERLGYYDESFGAAGDTEFKNRVLPFIKSKTLPQTLGVFLNYPEERTTQSPRAEIEDLRAWYLHRSPAGVAYALADRNPNDALNLFKKALAYRKSYFARTSSDLDYASAIASAAHHLGIATIPEPCSTAVNNARAAYQQLDWIPELSPRAVARERKRVEKVAETEAQRVSSILGLDERLHWTVFNDNRFEQHSNVWPAKLLTGTHTDGERFLWGQTFTRAALAATANSSEPADQHPSTQGSRSHAQISETIAAGLNQFLQEVSKGGKLDQVRDAQWAVKALQELAAGRPPPLPEGAGAGPRLCRVLADVMQRIPLSNLTQYEQPLADLCFSLAGRVAGCSPLADGFYELAEMITREREDRRVLEVVARLMSAPSPAEAVRRYRADLEAGVLKTLQRAAESAKLSGNLAYETRLTAMAAAVRHELDRRITPLNPGGKIDGGKNRLPELAVR